MASLNVMVKRVAGLQGTVDLTPWEDNLVEGCAMTEKFAALKRAKKDEPYMPDGYWGADHPKCPHCGFVCGISENDWWRLCEEGEHEVCCPQCDGDFTVSTRVSYSFSTDQQEDA